MKNIETNLIKKVVYQETDYLSEYKLANLLSVMADLATDNAIEIGMWNEKLNGQYGWVLSKQILKLSRPIQLEENIKISTRAKGGSRVQFMRTYDIENHDEKIGGAYSVWTLIDIKNRRIVKPHQAGLELPEIEEYDCYVDKFEPVLRNIETKKIMERQVLYNDVDVNQHMNNSKYIEWALDLLPYQDHQNSYIEQLSMHYRKEIAPLAFVELYYGQENKDFKIEFKVDDTVCFEMSGKQKERRKC